MNLFKRTICLASLAASCLCAATAADIPAGSTTLSPRWTAQAGTADSDIARGAAADAANNVFLVGYTSGAFAGHSNAGQADMFLVKYDSSGAVLWTAQLGTPADDLGFGVAVDTAGSAFVCGSTRGSLPGFANAGGADAFLAKFSPDGARQWIAQFGTFSDDEAFAVTVSSGNPFVTGYTSGTLGIFTNAGGKDVFLASFDAAGNARWEQQIGTFADDIAYGIAADATGKIYAAGSTAGTLGGTANAGAFDVFLARYDGAGLLQWLKQYGSPGSDAAFAVAASTDGAYIAGTTDGNLDGNDGLGGTDAFLARFTAGGTKQWTRQFGTMRDDRAAGVAVSSAAVYLAGSTLGALDGASAAGSWDMFAVAFDPAGDRGTAKQAGTPSADLAFGAAAAPSGNLLMAGSSAGGFNGGTNAGGEDAVLSMLRRVVVPVLRWTGEQGYTGGGVQPGDNVGAGTFHYRVAYVDAEDVAPQAGYPKVRVRQNGVEIAGSPFLMSSTAPGTTTFASGVIYTAAVALPAGTFSYRFEAFDALGNRAAGLPTAEQAGPVFRAPEVQDVKIFHGVFKAGEGETCTLGYTMDRSGEVGITVYDSLGRPVRGLFRGTASQGANTAVWDGRDNGGSLVASGVYIFRFDPGGKKTKKAVVIR